MKIVFLTIMFLSLSVFAQDSKTNLNSKIKLALNWKAEPEFGGFYAAEILGFFKEEGLSVEILEGGSGTPTVQMLANNKVDYAIVSADEVILSHDRKSKNKVKALYSVYETSPYMIMTHEESKFENLQQLFASNTTLSVQSGLPYYQFLVKKFGKPKGKVVPYLGGISNFLNDKNFAQQGFITTEPLSAQKAGVKPKSFLIADEGFNPYLVVVAANEDYLSKNPEQTKKFIKALHKGWIAYLKDPVATNKYMAKLNKAFDIETFHKAANAQKPLIENKKSPVGQMTKERWDLLVDQMLELKLIKAKIKSEDLFINP